MYINNMKKLKHQHTKVKVIMFLYKYISNNTLVPSNMHYLLNVSGGTLTKKRNKSLGNEEDFTL